MTDDLLCFTFQEVRVSGSWLKRTFQRMSASIAHMRRQSYQLCSSGPSSVAGPPGRPGPSRVQPPRRRYHSVAEESDDDEVTQSYGST